MHIRKLCVNLLHDEDIYIYSHFQRQVWEATWGTRYAGLVWCRTIRRFCLGKGGSQVKVACVSGDNCSLLIRFVPWMFRLQELLDPAGTSWSWPKAASTCKETDWSPSTFSVLFLWQDFFLRVDYTLTCSVVEDASPNLPKYFTACNSFWGSFVIIIHQSPYCTSQETTQLMHCNLKALHHHLEVVMPFKCLLGHFSYSFQMTTHRSCQVWEVAVQKSFFYECSILIVYRCYTEEFYLIIYFNF